MTSHPKDTPFSVAIITKNEEERLPACLASVSFCDDVVVIDSDSVDNTVAVAREHGARVFIEPWQGFSYQKQFAVNQCQHRWVLILDADERLPAETAQLIQQQLAKPKPGTTAYSLRRKNYLHGRWIKHCGWWPDHVLRLVDKEQGQFDGRLVHESWQTSGEVSELSAHLDHLSFRNYSELVAKMERYSNLGAEARFKAGEAINPFSPLAHGLWMVFRTYILESGWRDGFDGLVISLMNGAGSFFKYAKQWELVKHSKSNNQIT